VNTITEESTSPTHAGDPIGDPEMNEAKPVSAGGDGMAAEGTHAAHAQTAQDAVDPAHAANVPDMQGDFRRLQCDMTITKHVTARWEPVSFRCRWWTLWRSPVCRWT